MWKLERVALATNIAILLVTALTIGGELYAPLKSWLAATFLHHWLGKGALALIAFAAISLLPIKANQDKQLRFTIPLTIACTLALFAYFTWHFLAK